MGVIGLSAMGYAFSPLSYPAVRVRTRFPLIEEGIDFHGWRRGELLAVGGGPEVGIQ